MAADFVGSSPKWHCQYLNEWTKSSPKSVGCETDLLGGVKCKIFSAASSATQSDPAPNASPAGMYCEPPGIAYSIILPAVVTRPTKPVFVNSLNLPAVVT